MGAEVYIVRRDAMEVVSGPDRFSARLARREIEGLAYRYRRELGYEFMMYAARDPRADPRDECWLVRHDGAAIATFSFRWRTTYWGAQWFLVVPRFRRSGVLRSLWPAFVERYGEGLHPEPPVNEPMRNFLRRRGWICEDGDRWHAPGVAAIEPVKSVADVINEISRGLVAQIVAARR